MVFSVPLFVSKTLNCFKEDANFKVLSPKESRFVIVKTLHNSKTLDETTARWARSVVWDTERDKPVCVSPPKAEETPLPLGGWSLIQDHVDGVMINAFVVKGVDGVQIATRSYVGATNRFNGLRNTFAELFYKTMSDMNLNLADIVGALGDEEARFVSFVLVHPDICQVVPVVNAAVFAVMQGTVSADGTVSVEELPDKWSDTLAALAPKALSIPSFPTAESLEGFVDAKMKVLGWKWQGFSAKTEDGKRWRYTTGTYRKARSLRGNESDNIERFLRLRRSRAVQHYLKMYKEDTDAFWQLELKLRDVTQNVFNEYCLKNKAKSKSLKEVPPAYRVHVFGLHSLFIDTLKPQGKTLLKDDVIQYLNNQPLERVAHLLRVGGGSDTTRPMPKLIPCAVEANTMPGLSEFNLVEHTSFEVVTL